MADVWARGYHEPVSGRHISEYVDELTELGAEKFREIYPHAVLVRADSKDDDKDPAFRTAVVSQDDLDAIAETVRPGGPSSTPAGGGSFAGEVIPIAKRGGPFKDQIGVGRTRNVDVCLPLPGISKYHGFFTRVDSETYTVTDAGSTNGIRVGFSRIDPRTPTVVPDGTGISFGPYRFIFYGPRAFCAVVARKAFGA